jgi:hypothetical protein
MEPIKYYPNASQGNIPNIFGSNTSFVDKHQGYEGSSTEIGQFHNSTIVGHSSDHVHPGTLAAFWSAIIIYFCVILLIAFNGKSGSKTVVDYCLVKKVYLANNICCVSFNLSHYLLRYCDNRRSCDTKMHIYFMGVMIRVIIAAPAPA